MLRKQPPEIALVTYRQPDGTLRLGDDYMALIAHPNLPKEAVLSLQPVAWDDPTVVWDSFAAIVLQSPWNYHHPGITGRFLAWAQSLAHRPLWNPYDVIRWNIDKAYVREALQRFPALSAIPSVWFDPADRPNIADVMRRQGWNSAILKPRVGASGFQIEVIDSPDDAKRLHDALQHRIARDGGILQPFLPQVVESGEWSLIFLRDRHHTLSFSHAVLKHPASGAFLVQKGWKEMLAPPDAALQMACDWLDAASAITDSSLLYARVDGVMVGDRFLLMELELMEPGLSLAAAGPNGIQRYIDALSTLIH